MAIPHSTSPLSHLLEGRPVILASASPRRLELLRQVGIEAEALPAEIDEQLPSGEADVERVVVRLSRLKAEAVADQVSNGFIIAADTLVAAGDRVLGKPADLEAARKMLKTLSGRTHHVFTGVTVLLKPEGRMLSGASHTRVTFAPLAKQEMQTYIETAAVLDKAGAYGIQDAAGLFVERIEGSYSNVVGLPLEVLRLLIMRVTGEKRTS